MSDTTETGSKPGTEEPNGTEEQTGTESGEQTEKTDETPTVEALQAQVEEWKGHSRKWETRAKEHKDALDALKAEKGDPEALQTLTTERDEAVARAEKAEAALSRLTIAIDLGLSKEDADALSKVQGDEETLRALAERLVARSTGPKPNPAQGNRGGTPPSTNAEKFAEVLQGLF